MAEEMTSKELNLKWKKAHQNWFTFYSFSKNCAENVCAEFEGHFPIAIFRPAMVSHSYTEPKPFYIGNNLSFPKVLMEAHRGLVLFCDPECEANLVPVDFTVNAILAILAQLGQEQNTVLKIYNYTTNNHLCSASDAFRYYSNSIPDYEKILVPLRYKLMAMNEVTPGSWKDKYALVYLNMRQKIKRYEYFYKTVKFAAWLKLSYANNNIENLWQLMSEKDKQLLPFDIHACNWKKYFSEMATNQYGVDLPMFNIPSSDKAKLLEASTFLSLASKY